MGYYKIIKKYWGENPSGKWRLSMALKGVNRELAKMTKWKLGKFLLCFYLFFIY